MKTKTLLLILIFTSFIIRIIRIDYPKAYVFDEVYYVFTATEYLKGNDAAWTYWVKAPAGHAFAWVNPPFPQETMAFAMKLFNSTESFTWRVPGVLLGVLSIYLVYLLGVRIFKNERVGLISAFIFSIDGLNFVQSRTAMLDIYLVTFLLLTLLFAWDKKYFLSALFFGLSLGSKWTAVYILPLIFILLFKQRRLLNFAYYIFLTPLIYLTVYLPFFLTGHTFKQFSDLLNQEVWYHTHLKATHDYASPWWSWPLNLYPVWYFVDYGKNTISNIFASGTPLVFWLGSASIVFSILRFFKTKSFELLVLLLGFSLFWIPWAFSPRIMFIYYFAPSVPFLSLSLGYSLDQFWKRKDLRFWVKGVLILMFLNFVIFYPFLTGIPLPKNISQSFFRTNLAKNPFR